MNKRKSQPTHQTWHFITSLPFYECVHRLETWRESGISMKLSARNDESISYHIEYNQRFKQTFQANGTLQRWEGTHTRVNMNANLPTTIFSVIYRIMNILPLIVVGVGVLFCMFITEMSAQFNGLDPSRPNPVFVAIVFCVIGVAFIGSFILWMATPELVTGSELSKLRFMLRNRLCEGESSAFQYLVHDGRVENS